MISKKKNLGIDIENGFAPSYVISEEKKKTVTELKKLAKGAEKVWIATDEDREERQSGYLCEGSWISIPRRFRVSFFMKSPRPRSKKRSKPHVISTWIWSMLNNPAVSSIVSWVFKVSPVLWQKIKQGLSAGRVQSVAVKLIVEREREIQGFKPEES